MRERDNITLFTGDLSTYSPRLCNRGAVKLFPRLFVPAIADAAHDRLAEYVEYGEQWQALRSPEGLADIARRILSLPLGSQAHWIGKYYQALSDGRSGVQSITHVMQSLAEVADNAPPLFKAKALIALATWVRLSGDNKVASSLYSEATKIARRNNTGTTHPIYIAGLQTATIKHFDGDHSSFLDGLRRLEPLARYLGLKYPAMLHQYYNNVAVALAANGEIEEAQSYCNLLLSSPFLAAYPEWRRTCADIAQKTRTPTGSIISLGESFKLLSEKPILAAQPGEISSVACDFSLASAGPDWAPQESRHPSDERAPSGSSNVDLDDVDLNHADLAHSEIDHTPAEFESSPAEAAIEAASSPIAVATQEPAPAAPVIDRRRLALARRVASFLLDRNIFKSRAAARKPTYRRRKSSISNPPVLTAEVSSPRANRLERHPNTGVRIPFARAPTC
jgi:hypothetical protein